MVLCHPAPFYATFEENQCVKPRGTGAEPLGLFILNLAGSFNLTYNNCYELGTATHARSQRMDVAEVEL